MGVKIMKKTFLSFVLIAFFVLSLFHSCAYGDSFSITQASIESSADTGDILEWADGTFEGIIYDISDYPSSITYYHFH